MEKIKTLSRQKYAETNVLDMVRGKRKTVYAVKIVDVTAICRRTVEESGRTILKYLVTTIGLLVQCCNYDNPNENLGTGIVGLFNITKGSPAILIREQAFGEFALCVGISPVKLAHIVFKNVPQSRK